MGDPNNVFQPDQSYVNHLVEVAKAAVIKRKATDDRDHLLALNPSNAQVDPQPPSQKRQRSHSNLRNVAYANGSNVSNEGDSPVDQQFYIPLMNQQQQQQQNILSSFHDSQQQQQQQLTSAPTPPTRSRNVSFSYPNQTVTVQHVQQQQSDAHGMYIQRQQFPITIPPNSPLHSMFPTISFQQQQQQQQQSFHEQAQSLQQAYAQHQHQQQQLQQQQHFQLPQLPQLHQLQQHSQQGQYASSHNGESQQQQQQQNHQHSQSVPHGINPNNMSGSSVAEAAGSVIRLANFLQQQQQQQQQNQQNQPALFINPSSATNSPTTTSPSLHQHQQQQDNIPGPSATTITIQTLEAVSAESSAPKKRGRKPNLSRQGSKTTAEAIQSSIEAGGEHSGRGAPNASPDDDYEEDGDYYAPPGGSASTAPTPAKKRSRAATVTAKDGAGGTRVPRQRMKWTDDEVLALGEGMMKYGTNWAGLLGDPLYKSRLENRSQMQCKDKAAVEKEKRVKEAVKMGRVPSMDDLGVWRYACDRKRTLQKLTGGAGLGHMSFPSMESLTNVAVEDNVDGE
ncbi:UNVERIFIED_CONTAM: hypothetical protein HDU68_000645 [Siphonaria sp. JEL0065]|nr:hypothetical protein HDU68_000645 [Siphonaria sp. JEL0065]